MAHFQPGQQHLPFTYCTSLAGDSSGGGGKVDEQHQNAFNIWFDAAAEHCDPG
jgi:hypothetical protein